MSKKKYCKVCGCELPEDNKDGLCDRHRREKVGNVKKGVLGVLGTVGMIALAVITKGKFGGDGQA